MKLIFGGILLAIGILIAGASGLCSLYFIGSGLTYGGSSDELLSDLPLVLMVGGIPFAVGVGLIFSGRALIRSDREDWRR